MSNEFTWTRKDSYGTAQFVVKTTNQKGGVTANYPHVDILMNESLTNLFKEKNITWACEINK